MPEFLVTVRRTELITFRLEATDAADADYRALVDGEEANSELEGQPETVGVAEVEV